MRPSAVSIVLCLLLCGAVAGECSEIQRNKAKQQQLTDCRSSLGNSTTQLANVTSLLEKSTELLRQATEVGRICAAQREARVLEREMLLHTFAVLPSNCTCRGNP